MLVIRSSGTTLRVVVTTILCLALRLTVYNLHSQLVCFIRLSQSMVDYLACGPSLRCVVVTQTFNSSTWEAGLDRGIVSSRLVGTPSTHTHMLAHTHTCVCVEGGRDILFYLC